MSLNTRKILPPRATRKRKENEPSDPHKPPDQTGAGSVSICLSGCKSNRLLAGYMAYEFLTKGTLFGEKFDPAQAEAVPLGVAERTGLKPGGDPGGSKKVSQSYADVAGILMSDGAHLPGVVNPTQLARWIRM